MSIPNRGTAGSALDAVNNGLTRVEGGAVRFPTIAARLQSPYNTSLALSGEEFESVVRASVDNYVNVPLLSRYDFSTSGRSWTFCVAGNGNLILSITPDGTHASKIGYQSSAAPASVIPAGTSGWWKATFVGDNGNGNSEVNFYWAPDQLKEPTEWNALGGPVQGSVTTVAPGTAPLGVNTNDGSMGTPGLRWTLFRGILRDGVGGATLFDFDGEADISDPAATSFVCSTGQTLTVNRAASGPVTTLVPAGTVVYINPDDTNSNKINTADSAVYDVAPDDDFVLLFCGAGFNPLSGMRFVSTKDGATNGIWINYTDDQPSGSGYEYVDEGLLEADTLSGNQVPPIGPPVVWALVGNRSVNTFVLHTFDQAGPIGTAAPAAWATTAGTCSPSGGLTVGVCSGSGTNWQGSVSSYLWNKGVGIAPTDEQLASIAAALLANANRPPVSTTGTLPPTGHKVRGDRYRASNGHIAMFDGAKWVAQSPATGNIAALLGNNQLLLGAS
jgi:hypothetical protein